MVQIPLSELDTFVGREIGLSDWFLVTQERVNEFARVTEDYQWIHVDVERAERELEGTIAHGFLVLSLLPVLQESLLDITGVRRALNYGLNKVRFTGQVKTGKKIRLRAHLESVEQKNPGVLATYKFVMEIEGEERPALVAESLGLMYPS